MMESGQITSTRFMILRSNRKSDAHMALAVLPVPCSLKQNARRFSVRNADVVFWCVKGVRLPAHLYCFCIGEGAAIFKLLSTRVSSKPQFTSTLLSGNSLLFGMTAVTCCGFLSFNSNALPSRICTYFSPELQLFAFCFFSFFPVSRGFDGYIALIINHQ